MLFVIFLLPFLFSCRTVQQAQEEIDEDQLIAYDDEYADYIDYIGEPAEPAPEELAALEPGAEPVNLLPPFAWEDFPWQNFPPELNLPEFPPLEFETPEPDVIDAPPALVEAEPAPPPFAEPPPVAPLPVPPPVAPLPIPPPVAEPPPVAPQPVPAVPPPPPPAVFQPPELTPLPPPPPLAVPPLAPPPDRPPAGIGEDEITFSRVVRATVGQIVEIPFRGTGWVYLGELANRRGLSYQSRRLDTAAGAAIGQSFVFRAQEPGTYILRFFRQDFIQDYIINDHVQVIVGDAPGISVFGQALPFGNQDRVIAEPRWPPLASEVLPPAAAYPAEMPPAVAGVQALADPQAIPPAVIPPAADQIAAMPAPVLPPPVMAPVFPPQAIAPPVPAVPPAGSPADYVQRARIEFDAGRIESALGILDAMLARFPLGSDEAWWLFGQLLEANSPSRDIRRSLEFFQRLVSEYPQSNLVLDARRRIAHLERFFFHIR